MGDAENNDPTNIVGCSKGCGASLLMAAIIVLPIMLIAWACSALENDPLDDLPPVDRSKAVGRNSFDGLWPLTVERGEIRCFPIVDSFGNREAAFFVTPEGTRYALNGTARSQLDLPMIDPIWSENPDIPGTRVNASDLLDAARALC